MIRVRNEEDEIAFASLDPDVRFRAIGDLLLSAVAEADWELVEEALIMCEVSTEAQ